MADILKGKIRASEKTSDNEALLKTLSVLLKDDQDAPTKELASLIEYIKKRKITLPEHCDKIVVKSGKKKQRAESVKRTRRGRSKSRANNNNYNNNKEKKDSSRSASVPCSLRGRSKRPQTPKKDSTPRGKKSSRQTNKNGKPRTESTKTSAGKQKNEPLSPSKSNTSSKSPRRRGKPKAIASAQKPAQQPARDQKANPLPSLKLDKKKKLDDEGKSTASTISALTNPLSPFSQKSLLDERKKVPRLKSFEDDDDDDDDGDDTSWSSISSFGADDGDFISPPRAALVKEPSVRWGKESSHAHNSARPLRNKDEGPLSSKSWHVSQTLPISPPRRKATKLILNCTDDSLKAGSPEHGMDAPPISPRRKKEKDALASSKSWHVSRTLPVSPRRAATKVVLRSCEDPLEAGSADRRMDMPPISPRRKKEEDPLGSQSWHVSQTLPISPRRNASKRVLGSDAAASPNDAGARYGMNSFVSPYSKKADPLGSQTWHNPQSLKISPRRTASKLVLGSAVDSSKTGPGYAMKALMSPRHKQKDDGPLGSQTWHASLPNLKTSPRRTASKAVLGSAVDSSNTGAGYKMNGLISPRHKKDDPLGSQTWHTPRSNLSISPRRTASKLVLESASRLSPHHKNIDPLGSSKENPLDSKSWQLSQSLPMPSPNKTPSRSVRRTDDLDDSLHAGSLHGVDMRMVSHHVVGQPNPTAPSVSPAILQKF